ncbi:MAG: AAA family ATPase [Microcoleaceae cyanobacterium]
MQTHTLQLAGYHTLDLIHQGAKSLVHRGQRIADQKPVILKLLRGEYPSFSELVQFRNQYTITHNLKISGIVPALALEQHRNSLVLVMPDDGSISLADYLPEQILTLKQCLQLGIKITHILAQLYQNRIIHKDIKPANILVNPETLDIQLIDFSIASLLPKETQTIQNPNILEGTLAYISPEQTGRMNRGIDYRTDFYSLGVTLYELLTGSLPFETTDAMELVHCHIAKMPVALGEEVPGVVSNIVMKLMAKNGEDRYQSAWGIQKDLENCLNQLEKTGNIEEFKIAKQDICDQFNIPEKLYGRQQQVQQLLDAFARVANSCESSAEMMLVAGYSGVGKTAVVNEVHKPIVKQRGYFIKGKFDQFNRNIPFSAFVQALRDLMSQLLSESDVQLQQWKDKILEAVGENGQVIIEVIPELEKVIGTQSPVTELSGTAAQNRFNLLFQKFINVFTLKKHPLVIFLDDLQWADSASLNLLKLLISEADYKYLFLIGAYRDNEVNSAHPLMLTLNEIIKSEVVINTITLTPLHQNDLNKLIADTLHCSLQQASPLTEAVYQKTQGNPFFATQFLKALYEDKLIYFIPLQFPIPPQSPLSKGGKGGGWQCDLAQVKLAAVSEDVVEFVGKRLQKLNPLTQDALKLAACIGNKFDLETLAIVRQTSELETATDLWLALKEGLILPITEVYKFYTEGTQELNLTENTNQISASYKFLHDRVQQAAYALIPEDKKKETHLKIGQLLLTNIPETEREARIFEIVNQSNQGVTLIQQSSEQEELAQLNLIAAQKAQVATAYTAALEYCDRGIDLLSVECLQHQYDLTLELYNSAAENAYLSGHFQQMEERVEVLLQQTHVILDRIKAYEVKIEAYKAKNQRAEAISFGLAILEQLGVRFPKHPNPLHIVLKVAKTKFALAGQQISDLGDLPLMSDPEKLAAMRIIAKLCPAAYFATPKLFPLIVFKHVGLSLKYGNAPESAIAYGAYAVSLCGIVGDIEAGYQFGQLSLTLLDRLNAKHLASITIYVFNLLIRHWKEPLRESLNPLLRGYQIGLETGDLEHAAFSILIYCYYSYCVGKDLSALQKEMVTYREAITLLKQETPLHQQDLCLQVISNLQGSSEHPCELNGDIYDEQTRLILHQQAQDSSTICILYVQKMMLCYLFEDYTQALAYAELAEQYLNAVTARIDVALFYFYSGLTRLALVSNPRKSESKHLLKFINVVQKKLKKWANHAPMNYQHKVDLVEAEKCRILDNKLEAMELYDQAIAGAKENEYIQEEALANELAAKFYLDLGREKVAQTYMIEAYYCYSHWGAKAKTKDLEQRYPQLLAPILEQQKISLNPLKTITSLGSSNSYTQATISSNTTGISDALDFTSIIKASQVLSSEIELNQLISQLMQVMIENAGATKGVLMLSQDSQLTVKAVLSHNYNDEDYTNLIKQSIPVEESLDIPQSIINSVKRSLKPLNIEQVSSQTQLASDFYFIQQQPQSLLCLPLQNRGKFLGILYLENNLTIGAFTDERVEVLKLLCSQAAISLENAQLYQKSQDYAKQLEQSLKELKEAQVQLVQSEKMSALGEMMAGIAHEINNPVGFIGGNITHAEEYLQDLIEHLNLYQENCLEAHPEMAEHAEEIDLDYLLEDLPELISSMKTGVERIRNISTSMRTFSRSDTDKKVEFNLHEGIDSTLLILKHRLKAIDKRSEISIVKNYSNLPKVWGYPGQLNQVFMNLIANAIDVFDETQNIKNPQIMITTKLTEDGKQAIIKIKDNGLGMSEAVQQKIFEHLFTTKSVGKGTGLGLSISRQIIENKHSGILKCSSQFGKGTEFIIQIPIQ